jgi:hypothetical protein
MASGTLPPIFPCRTPHELKTATLCGYIQGRPVAPSRAGRRHCELAGTISTESSSLDGAGGRPVRCHAPVGSARLTPPDSRRRTCASKPVKVA